MATSSSSVLLAIAAATGDPARFTRELGGPWGERVSFALVLDAWARAAAQTGDGAFGLHFGERVPVGAFDLLDYAARSAPTLRGALERLVRFLGLLHDAVVVRLERHPRGAILSHRIEARGAREALRQATEAALSSYLARARAFTGRDVRPVEVRFVHAAPADPAAHRRVFGAPLRFGCAASGLVFSAETLALPVVSADEGLSAVLDRHAQAILASRPAATPAAFSATVARALAERLRGEEPRIAEIAGALGVSTRTLQRRLGEEGSSFQALLDGVRRDLAREYLADERFSLGEVAFLLGFSEASAFHRAFRRWTGRSPRAR